MRAVVCSSRTTVQRGNLLAIIFATLLAGCSTLQPPATNPSLNAILWVRTAAEYAASTTQAYHAASASLDEALSDPQWTAALEQQGDYAGLPPAIMLDIDQTVLNTAPYNVRLARNRVPHTEERFYQWCQEASAPAIPGAKDFIEYAVSRDVTVIYYTRRREYMRDCTVENLKKAGFPPPDPAQLLLFDKAHPQSKAQIRDRLVKQYRILLLAGDNLDDFVAGSKATPAARQELASRYAGRWGREWIILPNPMYGDWEGATHDFNFAMPVQERTRLKLRYLEE